MHGDGLKTPVWTKTFIDENGGEHKWEAGTLPDGSLIIKTSHPEPGVVTVDVLDKLAEPGSAAA